MRVLAWLVLVAAVSASCASRSTETGASCDLSQNDIAVRLHPGIPLRDSALRISVDVENRGPRCRLGQPLSAEIKGSAAAARIRGNPYRVSAARRIRPGRSRLLTLAWINWCGRSRGLTIEVRKGRAVVLVHPRAKPECLDSGQPSRLGPDLRARALRVVSTKGYAADSSTWDDYFGFNVLIGVYRQSADGYNKRAFFFLNGRYLGTDAPRASAQVQEVWRDDRTIALLYVLYRRSDPLCCPTGGAAIVRFDLKGAHVVRRDKLPPSWPAPLWR